MDKELEEYFNNYFELFRSSGWKQLIDDLNENKVVIDSIESAKDEQDLYFRKGQLNVIGTILNLETSINNGYEEQLSDD